MSDRLECRHQWMRVGLGPYSNARCINCGEFKDVLPPRRGWSSSTVDERLDAFHSYLEQTSEERARFRNHLSYAEEEIEAFDAGWAAAEAALKEKNA